MNRKDWPRSYVKLMKERAKADEESLTDAMEWVNASHRIPLIKKLNPPEMAIKVMRIAADAMGPSFWHLKFAYYLEANILEHPEMDKKL